MFLCCVIVLYTLYTLHFTVFPPSCLVPSLLSQAAVKSEEKRLIWSSCRFSKFC